VVTVTAGARRPELELLSVGQAPDVAGMTDVHLAVGFDLAAPIAGLQPRAVEHRFGR